MHANVTAIEPSETLIRTAREHLHTYPSGTDLTERIDYRVETIEEHLKQNTIKYDAIVVSEVLEHVDDKGGFLNACTEPLAVSSNAIFFFFRKCLRVQRVTTIVVRWIDLYNNLQQNKSRMVWWNYNG